MIAGRSKAGLGEGSLAPCAALDCSKGCEMRCLGSCSVQELKEREESGPENEGTHKSEADIATHHHSRSGAWLCTMKSCLGAWLGSAGMGPVAALPGEEQCTALLKLYLWN